MRFIYFICLLMASGARAESLWFEKGDFAPPQMERAYTRTYVKAVWCLDRQWGVVYDYVNGGGHTGVTYKGFIDYAYVNSAGAFIQEDTTPEYATCRAKALKHYELQSSAPAVVDLDAEDAPASAR